MAPKRPAPRNKRQSTPAGDIVKKEPKTPQPAKRGSKIDADGDMIMTSNSGAVLVPPSPGVPGLPFGIYSDNPVGEPKNKSRPSSPLDDRTAAGVKKAAPKKKILTEKVVDAAVVTFTAAEAVIDKGPFRFLDLPGEVRNAIYEQTWRKQRQALLVHRPRVGTLRGRTRLDRQRALASDRKDKALADELATSKRNNKAKAKDPNSVPRETNRPFVGLTQVCRQIRYEYRPIYLTKQEIGMDLTEICSYLETFYHDAPDKFALLNAEAEGQRGKDMPFNGNLTIAVGEKPLDLEKAVGGIEVIPLLDLWANSFKIEAGFGRYLKPNYQPTTDGEAKDLYRLFGRRVLRDRQCSGMNGLWRTILRNRQLASVTLHRKPAAIMVKVANLPLGRARTRALAAVPPPTEVSVDPKPFIHILFRPECAQPWMTQEVSAIPAGWLHARGFSAMEYFEIKVGVAPKGVDRRVKA